MAMSIFAGVNFNGGELGGAVIPPTAGNGTYTGEIRRNPATWIVEIWNGSTWVTPVSSGSLPAGTTDSMLKYDATTGVWENAPYLTYNGTRLRISNSGSTTQYAELFTASTMQIGMRLQSSTTKYVNINAAASFPLMEILGPTTTSNYAIKVGSTSVPTMFTVTNQGDIVGKSLRLSGLGTSSVGEFVGLDSSNNMTKLSQKAAQTALGLGNMMKGDVHTLLVSGDYPTPNTDGKHFATIDEAITYGVTNFINTCHTILVQAGEYSVGQSNSFARIHCLPGVKITNSEVVLLPGSSWTGHAEVSQETGSSFWLRPNNVLNTNPTIVEGTTIRVKNGCINSHIKCNYLQKYIGCIRSDYNTEIVQSFTSEIDCLVLGDMYMTRITDMDMNINSISIPPIIRDNYCQCEIQKGIIVCTQTATCDMWIGGATTDMLNASLNTKVTIRCNKRIGQIFTSAGKVAISGLSNYSWQTSLPFAYTTGEYTWLKLSGFTEDYLSAYSPYQVVNCASLVLDNMRMINRLAGGCIVTANFNQGNSDDGTKAYLSVSNCKLKSSVVELESFGITDALLCQDTLHGTSSGNSGFGEIVYNNGISVPSVYWENM